MAMLGRRPLLSALAAAALPIAPLPLATLPRDARAQGSARTIRVIIGFPPGGTSDIVGRLFAERMRGSGGVQAITDNRPGAGGRIALETLKSLPPDGNALVITPASMLTIYPHIYTKTMRYDSVADFTAVTPVCSFPFAFTVRKDHPATTLPDYVAWAKGKGLTDFASPVPGSMPHFIGAELGRIAGIQLNHVPYRGSAPAVQDLLAGTIPAVLLPLGETSPFHRSGDVRIIAQTGGQRLEKLPQIPTFAESGYPTLVHEEWYGAVLPAHAPEQVVAQLHAALIAAAAAPEMKDGLGRIDMAPLTSSPSDFAARIRQERDAWKPIVAASGFKADE
jgi:tripartite-type tricarboxylate transporter receptor subunit TctC